MSDQFDKKLVDRINEVFDNYDDGSAAEGWKEMRKNLPENKVPRLKWVSAAAAVLVISGIWLFFDGRNSESESLISKKTKGVLTEPANKEKAPRLTEIPVPPETNNTPAKKDFKQPRVTRPSASGGQKLSAKKNRVRKNYSPENTTGIFQDELTSLALLSHIDKKATQHNSEAIIQAKQSSSPAVPGTSDSMGETPGTLEKAKGQSDLMTGKINPEERVIAHTPVHTKQPENTQDLQSPAVQPNELLPLTSENDKATRTKSRKAAKAANISLAFFAGSYMNYAQGSKSNINSGFGMSSEIKISKKLKISTGVSLGQNTLKYNQVIPEVVAQNFVSDNTQALNAVYQNNLNTPAGSVSSMKYSINSYNAKLVGFDIPVNLKYSLVEGKNTIYLSSGVSSNFFLNESYTYDFDYQLSGANNLVKIDNEKSSSTFQSVDLAKVLNFSIGLDHPLNKHLNLIFEPFVKHPLSGLGTHNLRFGSVGMNLKLKINR